MICSHRKLLLAGAVILGLGDFFRAGIAFGTPLIALREVNNCDGCHNGGRPQRPVLWRRCTLDCAGCHVDPAGSGGRNAWGRYYSLDQQAMVNFFKPSDPLEYQNFAAAHVDSRLIALRRGQASRQFPMATEFSLEVKPFRRMLSFQYGELFLGRSRGHSLSKEADEAFRRQKKWAVMVDELPMNTYVRYYAGQPMYGLRRPNHTLWIRERIGLGLYAHTQAVEAGGTPNVPYWRVSQMSGDPRLEEGQRQKGTSYHAGFRGVTLGWHMNVSGWQTASETHEVAMRALGLGANIFGTLLYGERNWRSVEEAGSAESGVAQSRLHPSSTISEYTVAYGGLTGWMVGAVWEEYQDARRESQRLSYFLDVHPIPWLQLEVWLRQEMGDRDLADTLFIAHFFADI